MNGNVNKITLEELKENLPGYLCELLDRRNSAALLLEALPRVWEPASVSPEVGARKTLEQRLWELIGLYILKKVGPYEALAIFMALYDHMLLAQEEMGYRVQKGMPLVWISDCFLQVGFPYHAKRYLMLTLCEDSITSGGEIDPEKTGIYFRLVWRHGLPDYELQRYAKEMYEVWEQNPCDAVYPEWVLQEVDQDWITEYPRLNEASKYFVTKRYVRYLLSRLGEPTGQALERLGAYVLSCVPGFRATTRRRSRSTEYDIVCSVEGSGLDFRSEMGRYFVCECKDLERPADFSILAKFCRVLDSTKCRFGVLFSTSGISGEGRGTYAEREQVKIYQDRGLVIVVVNKVDLRKVAEGGNFVGLLRDKYEKVRLDLV
jgi:hypothetical protein